MKIEFDLPDGPAQLLLRLASHIREHAGQADVNQICQSFVTDILIDDALQHGPTVALACYQGNSAKHRVN